MLSTTPPDHVSLTARGLSQQTLADRAFRLGRHHLIALARPATSGHVRTVMPRASVAAPTPRRRWARSASSPSSIRAPHSSGGIQHPPGSFGGGRAACSAPPRLVQLAAGRPGSGQAGLRESHFEAQPPRNPNRNQNLHALRSPQVSKSGSRDSASPNEITTGQPHRPASHAVRGTTRHE